MNWLRMVPAARWATSYSSETLRADAVAGVTVGVMLIPQAMAYAVIAGLPPIYGLYAALAPPLIYAVLGSSRHLAIGPVALDMLIVAAGLSGLAATGSAEYVALTIALTALAGVFQVGMGLAQFGFAANLLSRPVITGLTTAAAIIIAGSQLGTLMGISLPQSQYVHVLVTAAIQNVESTHLLSLAIGGGCVAVLVLLRRLAPWVPGALVVVVGATLVSWLGNVQAAGVDIVGSIPTGLPEPRLPDLSLANIELLWPAALTLALVQFMKNASLGRVFATRHNYTINANQELVGIGAANAIGSLFQGIPASGSFSRSAVNDQAGARTPMANVMASVVIILTLLFLTPLFRPLPAPALAAIIMVAGFGLIDLEEIQELFETRRRDGTIALLTAGSVLFIGIQAGIIIGIVASVLLVLHRISRPNVAELGHVPGTRLFRDLERFEQAEPIDDILVLRVDAAFSFANAEYFKDFILDKSEREGRSIKVVVIDGTSINDLDTTAIEALESMLKTLRERGIDLHFTSLIGPVREVVRRSDLYQDLGEDHFHLDPHDAVTHVLQKWDRDDDITSTSRESRYMGQTEPEKKESTPAAS
ncbi:SulP family inorganic anion transporter [Salisaeta longa]|uniref:SulP family inorganic anion transporter n=1 Tax=Salisaeta longa TaxID=503170 RepID=UPI0003B3FE14|nr:sulfate permease [Salisaeta longa]